ncbi:MAG: hypothetical protein V3S69_00080 [Dehalococcoidales bacterium]
MATVAAVAAIVTAVAAVGSAVVTHKQNKKVAAQQRRQNMLANKQASRDRARSIQKAVAQQRVVTADIEQSGFSFGVAGSSSVATGAGGGQSDLAANIGASNQQFSIQSLIGQSQDKIAGIRSQFNPFAATQAISNVFSNAQTNRAVANQF